MTEEKFWISDENVGVFSLWLHQHISIFMQHANCADLENANKYKETLSCINNSGSGCFIPSKFAYIYDVFVQEISELATANSI